MQSLPAFKEPVFSKMLQTFSESDIFVKLSASRSGSAWALRH